MKMWIFKCVLLVSLVVFVIAQPIGNALTTENDKSNKDSAPPIEFPQNDSKFPVVDTNATLLHELSGSDDSVAAQELEVKKNIDVENNPVQTDAPQTKDNPKPESKNPQVDDSKIDTEVPDLLKLDQDLIEPEHNDIVDVKNDIDSADQPPQALDHPELVPEEPFDSVTTTVNEDFPKAEVEWIQNGHDNEDVKLMADYGTLAPSHDYVREAYSEHGRGVPLVQGRYAAILAGVFIVLAVVGYAAMLSWRRYLENRYGNRQMLINEDDIYSTDDLKHFSL